MIAIYMNTVKKLNIKLSINMQSKKLSKLQFRGQVA